MAMITFSLIRQKKCVIMKKNKAFDCVEMKKIGGELIYNKTKDLTFNEKVEYWKQRSEEFERWRGGIKSHRLQ